MGLLDYADAARKKLAGLLGDMPLVQMMQGRAEMPTMGGLLGALKSMPVFSPDAGQSAYETALNIGPMGLGKIVYHGSPHKFDKFDASKIGTGEGAQAYGHGVYLADAEDVAKGYQKTLAYKAFDLGQEAEKRGLKLTAGARGEFHRQAAANRDPMRAAAGLQNANISARELPQEKLAELFDAFQKDGTGALYKADLPDEWIPKMLDWDKPLSQQPDVIRTAVQQKYPDQYAAMLKASDLESRIKSFADKYGKRGDSYVDAIARAPEAERKDWLNMVAQHRELTGVLNGGYMPTSGESFYRSIGDDSGAADYLKSLGVPGIRYLDGGSRGKGQGSYNYVVFPGLEDQVKILERNGVPLGLIGGN